MQRFGDRALSAVAAELGHANEVAWRAQAARDKRVSVEDERKRIARELHDQLGQQLTALKLDLGWLLRRHRTGERDGVDERLLAMTELVDETLRGMQKIALQLRVPEVPDDRGLVDALASAVREVQRRTNLHFRLDLPSAEDFRVPAELATPLLYAFQEIINNVVRHADATNVDVHLERTETGLRLDVRDDGRGITLAEATAQVGSLGLVGMRERVSLMRGTLDLQGASGRGTRVCISVPFE